MSNKTDSQTLKRQQILNDAADKYMRGLITEFIKFKNKHFKEKRGVLTWDPEVMVYLKRTIETWQNYCAGMNRNSNRLLNYNYDALPETLTKHLMSHQKLAWVNYCMKLLKRVGVRNPDMDVLEGLYRVNRDPWKGVGVYMPIRVLKVLKVPKVLKVIKNGFRKLIENGRNNNPVSTSLIPEAGIS